MDPRLHGVSHPVSVHSGHSRKIRQTGGLTHDGPLHLMVLEAEGQDQAARRCRVRGGPVASQMVLLVCSRSLDVAEGRGNWGGALVLPSRAPPSLPPSGGLHTNLGGTHTLRPHCPLRRCHHPKYIFFSTKFVCLFENTYPYPPCAFWRAGIAQRGKDTGFRTERPHGSCSVRLEAGLRCAVMLLAVTERAPLPPGLEVAW